MKRSPLYSAPRRPAVTPLPANPAPAALAADRGPSNPDVSSGATPARHSKLPWPAWRRSLLTALALLLAAAALWQFGPKLP